MDWRGEHSIADFLKYYRVYPELTRKLDKPDWMFTQEIINEIALWKVARYVKLSSNLLVQLDGLRSLKPKQHEKGAEALTALLGISGVRLPMASTFLRFANPQVFQIFDQHIYRAVFGILPKEDLSKKPSDCVPYYIKFLNKLHSDCETLKIPFSESDRILFEFDRRENPPLKEGRREIGQ